MKLLIEITASKRDTQIILDELHTMIENFKWAYQKKRKSPKVEIKVVDELRK